MDGGLAGQGTVVGKSAVQAGTGHGHAGLISAPGPGECSQAQWRVIFNPKDAAFEDKQPNPGRTCQECGPGGVRMH